jgi:hypothetical protein
MILELRPISMTRAEHTIEHLVALKPMDARTSVEHPLALSVSSSTFIQPRGWLPPEPWQRELTIDLAGGPDTNSGCRHVGGRTAGATGGNGSTQPSAWQLLPRQLRDGDSSHVRAGNERSSSRRVFCAGLPVGLLKL